MASTPQSNAASPCEADAFAAALGNLPPNYLASPVNLLHLLCSARSSIGMASSQSSFMSYPKPNEATEADVDAYAIFSPRSTTFVLPSVQMVGNGQTVGSLGYYSIERRGAVCEGMGVAFPDEEAKISTKAFHACESHIWRRSSGA